MARIASAPRSGNACCRLTVQPRDGDAAPHPPLWINNLQRRPAAWRVGFSRSEAPAGVPLRDGHDAEAALAGVYNERF